MDDYILLAIPMRCSQLYHVSSDVITALHDMFPPGNDD